MTDQQDSWVDPDADPENLNPRDTGAAPTDAGPVGSPGTDPDADPDADPGSLQPRDLRP